MNLRTQSASRKRNARRIQLEVETLEARVAPCTDELGVGGHVHGDDGPDLGTYPAVVVPQPLGPNSATDPSTTTAATGLPLPVLNSLPGASATLYLNFRGDLVSNWLGYSNLSIPAFDTDGDGAALSQGEVNTITQIWQIAAENYAPFNINVSTVDPRTVSGYSGTVSQLDVGGNGSWTGGTYGGLAQIGGLAGSSANNPVRGFVFPDNLGNGAVYYTGEAISHESGHTMGLNHQAAYSGSTKTAEYQQGPGDGTAPILGVSYYATRGMWWYGQSAAGSTVYQDDMAVISSNFGYRPDETGSTASTAAPLTVAGTQVSASGMISTMSDVDVWSFSTGAGSVSLSVSAPSYGNLHPKIELWDTSGNVIAGWQDPDSGTASWTGTLAAGSYRVVVASHGISSGASATNYGFDVGTYTITGSTATPTTTVAAPTNLSASATSTSQINLTWTDNATNATSYSVERSTDGTTWSPITTLGANSTSYTDSGLSSATTYSYRVRAFNGTMASGYSNQTTATTLVSPPAAPSNLLANVLSTSQIQLSWTDNAANATSYSVERSSDGTTWTQITTLGANSTSYTDSGLTAGTTFYYRVRDFNGTTASGYSNQTSATTLVSPPAAPSNLLANVLSPSQIQLSWTDNATNATSYSVERSSDGTTWSQVTTLGAHSTSYTDSGLAAGTTYYYRVRDFNGTTASGYSNVISATTLVSPPAAPSNLLANVLSTSQIQISWTDNATNETSYGVERSSDGTTWSQVTTLGAHSTSYTDSGLAAGTTYYYRVRDFNGTTASAYSNAISATTLVSPPAAPSNLLANVLSTSQIQLTWTDNATNATSYSVERSSDGTTWSPIASLGANSTSYTDSGLAAGTTYAYRVRAFNGTTPSDYSNAISATTLVSPPDVPSNLVATALSATQIRLGWTDNATTETSYSVERSSDGTTWTQITTLGAHSTSYTDTGLAAGTRYSYRVRDFNGTTASGYSNQISATTLVSSPAAPSNLLANALSISQIQLSWTDNATNATSCSVERSSDGTTWSPIASLGANNSSYTDTGLTAGTTYSYRVRAFNGTTPSDYSNQTSATTLVSPPTAPSNLLANVLSPSQIQLSWTDNATNATSCSVERSSDGTTWSPTTTLGAHSTSYTDSGLTAGTTYYYRVRDFNGTTASGYSNAISATTLVSPPAAPSNLVATALSTTQIQLGWTDNATTETSYSVERSSDGTTWSPITTLGAHSTSYTDGGLASSTTYYYRVRAFNGSTPSDYSNAISATTLVSTPAAPSNLLATVLSTTQIQLSWNDNATTETSYSVERSSDGTTWSPITTLGAHSTSYTDSGLASGTIYYYRVRDFNDTTASTYSNAISATTLVSPPAAPSNLIAPALSTTQIQLSWTDNATNETSYGVERSSDGTTWSLIATLGAHSTSYTDTGLAAGTTYYYRVRAFSGTTPSGYSNQVSATTTISLAAPSNLVAKALSGGRIQLTWNDNTTHATGYSVERGADGKTWIPIATLGATSTNYTDSSLASGMTPYYRVRAFSGTTYSAYSNRASATTTGNLVTKPPAAPSNLMATLLSGPQIQLTWTDNATNETGFYIERAATNQQRWLGSYTLIATVGAGVTSYSDGSVVNSTSYSYRIRAFNSAGMSEYTSVTPKLAGGLVNRWSPFPAMGAAGRAIGTDDHGTEDRLTGSSVAPKLADGLVVGRSDSLALGATGLASGTEQHAGEDLLAGISDLLEGSSGARSASGSTDPVGNFSTRGALQIEADTIRDYLTTLLGSSPTQTLFRSLAQSGRSGSQAAQANDFNDLFQFVISP